MQLPGQPFETFVATGFRVGARVPNDVVVDVQFRTPEQDIDRRPPGDAVTVCRIVVSPRTAKALALLLQKTVDQYERIMGPLEGPGDPGWTPHDQR